MTLPEFFTKNPKVALGFSGGVDSAYLLHAGIKFGADIRPYYIKTAFQPKFEYEDALRFTEELGIKLHVIDLDILSLCKVTENPKNRCYYCKKALFRALKDRAAADGYSVIIDGTNADDDASDRPGMKAIEELGVRSPLRECSMGKDEIRILSQMARLSTWSKPSYSCLATRIPSGDTITVQKLEKVEKAENELFRLGFTDFRVRMPQEKTALLQFKKSQIPMAIEVQDDIIKVLTPYFDKILFDPTGR